MSNFHLIDEMRHQLTGIAALLDKERAMRLAMHLLCSWLMSKLNGNDVDNNEDDDDDDTSTRIATSELRMALLSTGMMQATVDDALKSVDWKVSALCCRLFVSLFEFLFFFFSSYALARSQKHTLAVHKGVANSLKERIIEDIRQRAEQCQSE